MVIMVSNLSFNPLKTNKQRRQTVLLIKFIANVDDDDDDDDDDDY